MPSTSARPPSTGQRGIVNEQCVKQFLNGVFSSRLVMGPKLRFVVGRVAFYKVWCLEVACSANLSSFGVSGGLGGYGPLGRFQEGKRSSRRTASDLEFRMLSLYQPDASHVLVIGCPLSCES
mmetsp:Transcript_59719/g.158944  ORF Transcript_59719/g.158944 Transcript_59719/m.158944 type:complete len:122 (-) Transcript_59719:51-416(-)